MYPSILVGKIYRHPHATAKSFDYLETIFRKMSVKRKPLFIPGNLDDLNKSNAKLTGIINKDISKQFINNRITEEISFIVDVDNNKQTRYHT